MARGGGKEKWSQQTVCAYHSPLSKDTANTGSEQEPYMKYR